MLPANSFSLEESKICGLGKSQPNQGSKERPYSQVLHASKPPGLGRKNSGKH